MGKYGMRAAQASLDTETDEGSSQAAGSQGSRFKVKHLGVKSIRMPGLFLTLGSIVLITMFQAHHVFEHNKKYIPEPRKLILDIINNETRFAKQQKDFAAVLYDEEHFMQQIEAADKGHNGGVVIILATMVITGLFATFNLRSFAEPGKKLVADSFGQSVTTCIQATFTETGAVGISSLIQILVLFINELGIIRLISLAVFTTETTVANLLRDVHWGLQFFALVFLVTLIVLVYGSYRFQGAWRQANYIRLNAMGKISADMDFLRAHPNHNVLLFWKKFKHGNPYINNRRLTYWTMETLADRFIEQLGEFGFVQNHFDFAEYLSQRTTKTWVRLVAVKEMSAITMLCFVLLLRPYLALPLEWKLQVLAPIGFSVLLMSKGIMSGWQSQLRRLLMDPDRIRIEMRARIKDDKSMAQGTFRNAFHWRLNKLRRSFTGFGRERQEFLSESMNAMLMVFVFWCTVVIYMLPEMCSYAWPLFFPILLIYVIFIYIMNTMVYFCVLCSSVENMKDLPLVQSVKTQQIANDAFQAMYLCHGLAGHIKAGWSSATSKRISITEEQRGQLALKEHRQINYVTKMVFGDDASKRDEEGHDVEDSKEPPLWETQIDDDGNRSVSIEGLCKCMGQFQLKMKPEEVIFVFPELQRDLTEQQLTDILVLVVLSVIEEDTDTLVEKMCDAVWDMLDVQGDGDIDLFGFVQQFTTMVHESYDGSVSGLDAEDNMLLLGSLDSSGDGTIDAPEFKKWLASFIGKYRFKYDINT